MSLLDLGAVTVAGYRARTGDTTTADGVVETALEDAESLLDEELRRLLAWDTRTEVMRIQPDARMYPKAYPVTACATNLIEGRALLGGVPGIDQFVALIGTPYKPRATVEYQGGYGSPTTPLPITLAHALYDVAQGLAADTSALPVGVTSMSVGDVHVSLGGGAAGTIDAYSPGVSARIAKYKNDFVS